MANQELNNKINNLEKKIVELTKILHESESKKKETDFGMQEQQEVIEKLHFRIETLEQKIEKQFLTDVKEFQLGWGDTTIKMDRQGLWVGKNKFEDAIADNALPDGADGTAIAIDGTFYAKDGFTGTQAFLDSLGPTSKTITVVNGIITDIS